MRLRWSPRARGEPRSPGARGATRAPGPVRSVRGRPGGGVRHAPRGGTALRRHRSGACGRAARRRGRCGAPGRRRARREAAALLAALETKDDPFRELLVAQALLAATLGRRRGGGNDRLDRALDAAEAAAALDESPLHLLWAGRGRFMRGHNDEAARLARRAVDGARGRARSPFCRRRCDCLHPRTSIAATGGLRTRPQAKPSSSDVSSSKIPRSARAWAYSRTSTQRRGTPTRAARMRQRRLRLRPRDGLGSTANERNAHSDAWISRSGEPRRRSSSSRPCTRALRAPAIGRRM